MKKQTENKAEKKKRGISKRREGKVGKTDGKMKSRNDKLRESV
jgi:hypothetical protein